jgi:uncharacterized membrane protein required for colicin V production
MPSRRAPRAARRAQTATPKAGMPTLNITDLDLAIIWLFCSIRGYMRGLVKEVGSLAALAMGFYCAGTYHKALAPHLTDYISGNYAGTAAYLLIFTVTLIGVWMLALAISGIVKITMTQWADRLFGGAFGLAKGVLITAAILFLIHLASPHPDFLKGSILIPVLDRVSARLVHFIPPDINQKLRGLGKKTTQVIARPEAAKKATDKAQPEQNDKKAAPAKPETAKKNNDKAQANHNSKKAEPDKSQDKTSDASRQPAQKKHAD